MTSSTTSDPDQRDIDQEDVQTGDVATDDVPRMKRIACILCRKRKLRCDSHKPSCGTCSRLNHHCEYSEERKKSGPKRGYVKLLEARLKQVENLLESRDSNGATASNAPETTTSAGPGSFAPMSSLDIPNQGDTSMSGMMLDPAFTDPLSGMQDFTMNAGDDFSWEMIGLGLEEALPAREVIDELNEIYFDKIHPSLPMIHKARYLASMDLAPHMRPAVCLRYAMWTHACAITPKYSAYTEHFYARARKYAEMDEMRGHGEGIITIAHSQCWTLLACYEFRVMYFPRAWMSIGRAARLAQMMGLHRQDRIGLDVKQTLPPPRDWTDREERRRTFWMAYCQDRYASIGTGWPMVIDERDILTNLPASEDAFTRGQPEPTLQLSDILNGDGAASLSSFGGVILLSTIFGRNLTHLHRPSEQDNDHDLNGAFWKRHRSLDNILLNTSLSLPAPLRLPAGISDPNTVFLNMNIHTATICLHQAAIFKSDKNRLPAQISAESKRRCIVAADQITNIMKMISHMDMSSMNPFLAFCLYVASRVFVQYLKARKEDAAVKSSLHFLLAAMQVLKAKNPLTESFLVQLDVDLEGSGLDIPSSHSRWKFSHRGPGQSPVTGDGIQCSPLFEIRSSQGGTLGQETNPKGVHPPWPSESMADAALTSGGYPSLYATEGLNSGDQFSQATAAGSSGDSLDNGFGFPITSIGTDTSPGTSLHDSSSSRPHSNHPTPSTSSNPASTHTTHTSPPNAPSGGGEKQSASASTSTTFNFPGNTTSWNMNMPSHPATGASPQTQGFNFNSASAFAAGPTGLTPGAEAFWPGDATGDANDWIFPWPGSTPQP